MGQRFSMVKVEKHNCKRLEGSRYVGARHTLCSRPASLAHGPSFAIRTKCANVGPGGSEGPVGQLQYALLVPALAMLTVVSFRPTIAHDD